MVIDRLVGPANEVELQIEGKPCQTLLDSGSMVSTISEEYYTEYLSESIELQPLEDILEVEDAGEHKLPYTGYIEVDIVVPETGDSHTVLILVVPTTTYHRRTPCLLGTNVIKQCILKLKEGADKAHTQKRIPTAWEVAHRCMTAYDQQIRKSSGKIGIVKSEAKRTIPLQSNQTLTLEGKVTRAFCYRQSVMLCKSDKSVLPPGVEITPAVYNLKVTGEQRIQVTVSNLSAQTVIIPPSATICGVEEVDIHEMPEQPEIKSEDIADLNIDLTSTEENLTTEQMQELRTRLCQWEELFAKDDEDLGHTDAFKHKIVLMDDRPFKQRFRRIPPGVFQELRQHLKQMLDSDVIQKSHSPWASNIVLVRKKDGKLRFCIDYRQLNLRTVKDAYAIPRMEDTLDQLHGKKWFSTLDLKSGYWQVEMEDDSKACTAFTVGPLGHFECKRLPFGLTNSPATFQRLMEHVLEGLNMDICLEYLDDVIIFSDSYEEHLQNLETVFQRIQSYGLKLNAAKCKFFQRRVKYLGHIITCEGLEVVTDKTDTLKNWPVPKNVDELRSYLGFTGYYRKFVKDYAKIARPLNDLLCGMGAPTNTKKKRPVKTAKWQWGQEQQNAFELLIEKLCSPPVLAFPDFQLPFVLHTDASIKGLGAVLYQVQEGKERVIAYASRGLKSAEINYPAHKLEFLAAKWAVTDKFKDLLYCHKFEIVTDNNPLTYVLSSAKLDATGQRWIAALAEYDFTLRYRSGKQNQDADSLSRLPIEIEQRYETVSEDSIKAIGQNCKLVANVVEAFTMNLSVADQLPGETDNLDQHNYKFWRKAQRDDLVVRTVIERLSEENSYVRDGDDKEITLLLKEKRNLTMRRGVLYRRRIENEREVYQLILPQEYRLQALTGLHDDVGHPGKDRTVSLIRERFYWPLMKNDVDEKVDTCERCILRKARSDTAPLVSITTNQPLELICLDFLSLEPSKGGIENVLVITDHFTRYAQAYPTANQTAKTTAKVLFDNFIVNYGFPVQIHSDQGANFESKIISELCELAGVKKTHTTPYHPMGNGMTERFNRTLIGMLGTLQEDQKKDWKSFVKPLVHAYNATKHESTGFSPFYLMFGRNPRLALDVVMKLPEEDGQQRSYTEFVTDLRDRLDFTYKLVTKEANKSSNKQKKQYDKKLRHTTLSTGDRVLVKRTAFKGKHKLANRWEEDAYIVQSKPNEDIPVYIVQRESDSLIRTLHRNLLLPINSLPVQMPEKSNKIRKSTLKKSADEMEHISEVGEEPIEDSDEVDSEDEDLVTEEKLDKEEELEGESEAEGEDQAAEEVDIIAEDIEPDLEVDPEHQDEAELAVGPEHQDELELAVGPEHQDEAELAVDPDQQREPELVVEPEPLPEPDETETEPAVEPGAEELIPRRSTRITRPPERLADYVMQQKVSSRTPTPAPRHKTGTYNKTHMSHIQQNTPMLVHRQRPTPTPRKRVESRSEKGELLNVVLGLQEKQCKIHEMIMNLLKES